MNPLRLLGVWIDDAHRRNVAGPRAMTLSTLVQVGGRPRPRSRVVILRGLEDGALRFSTSRLSPKAAELAACPAAAANLNWPETGRQIRVVGEVRDAGREAAVTDFLARSPESRAECMSPNQSEVLRDPEQARAAYGAALARVRSDPEFVPEHWVAYDLVVEEVEFWQLDPARLHERLRYRRVAAPEVWVRERLWP